ncbi:MAG TPA: hypothetical protein VH041_13635 [Caldimonas sp.]|nr:hypothetical protein [Caldimonas sp.]HEX4235332.1 hypothetical protein [Caldimonas sp.]
MRIRTPRAFVALGLTLFATIAAAWRPDGHHTVGAIADRLISATHAEAQVRTLLGNLSLEQAAVWADCAKGVDPAKNFAYTAAGKYPECALYETADGEAEMIDFVRRNAPAVLAFRATSRATSSTTTAMEPSSESNTTSVMSEPGLSMSSPRCRRRSTCCREIPRLHPSTSRTSAKRCFSSPTTSATSNNLCTSGRST